MFGVTVFLVIVSGIEGNETRRLDKHHRQSRVENSKKSQEKVRSDMQTVLQQHLVGPGMTSPSTEPSIKHESIWSKFGKEDSKKGKLQTVGSVIGDIIGVLVSEIARFFGSVVSDVAREVTAHGFVSLIKQIADLTRGPSGPPTPMS